jgi:hypothetical protein
MEQPRAPEAPQEKVLILDRAGLFARQAEILALSSDHLNVSKGLDKQGLLAERKVVLGQIGETLRDMHPSKLVLVTELDGKITGCGIVDKGEHASLEHLWTLSGSAENSVFTSLVNSALAGLKHGPHTYERLHINADPVTRSSEFQRYLSSFPENSSKLVIGAAGVNDNEPGLEKAA